jgi:small subunit ribosomal protein S16
LTRVGKKKQPSYRIVVADSRSPRDGAFLKIIGHYNPRTEPMTLDVKEDEAIRWLRQGAQPSETVAKLLSRLGIMEKAGLTPVRRQAKGSPPSGKTTKAPATQQQEPAPATEAEPTAKEG